jgi:hypothetical protein
MISRQVALQAFFDGIVVGVIVACLIGLAICVAHAQDSGFSVQPDGSVTQWNTQSGYSAGPSGTAAWNAQGG